MNGANNLIKGLIFLIRLILGLGIVGLTFASVFAFLGFASPLLDAFNHLQLILFVGTATGILLAIVFFLKSKLRTPVLSLAFLGLLLSAITVIPEQLSPLMEQPKPGNGQPVIKLMSNNMFGLNYDMDRMAAIVAQQNPDIIAFQEYFEFQQGLLHPQLVGEYPFFMRCGGRKQSFIALYSKTAFTIEAGTQCASNPSMPNNPAARIIARLSDETGNEYSVVVTHLNWPIQVNPLFRDELDFDQKLLAMSVRKQAEWKELTEQINAIEGPVIVAGDFNSTGWSYAMDGFISDTGLIRYSKGLLTYPKLLYLWGWRETVPFLSIDHIMASEEIYMQRTWVGEQTGSDHLPLYAQFSVGE